MRRKTKYFITVTLVTTALTLAISSGALGAEQKRFEPCRRVISIRLVEGYRWANMYSRETRGSQVLRRLKQGDTLCLHHTGTHFHKVSARVNGKVRHGFIVKR